MTNDPKTIAIACLEAWTRGDFDAAHALVDNDIAFVGPLGEAHGVAAYLKGLHKLEASVASAKRHLAIAEGDRVCVIYDLITKRGATVQAATYFRVRDGRIVEARAVYDTTLVG